MTKKRKILFVGMPGSPHAARWIDLVADAGWELHFFPVHDDLPNELMRNVTFHYPWISCKPIGALKRFFSGQWGAKEAPPANGVKITSILPLPVSTQLALFLGAFRTAPLGKSDVRAPFFFGPHMLALAIRRIKPDLIHSMEFQHAGYRVLRAKELMNKKHFPKWLATNWGSDIYYYRHFPEHNQQIRQLLQNIDYYSCECARDVTLARELGLTAPAMPVLPNTGGFNIEALEPIRNKIRCSGRTLIMVKGYEHFAGRALMALEALLLCKEDLGNYRIAVYAASNVVRQRAQDLRVLYGLNIIILPYLTHQRMLDYYAHARIYLGVSASDAISTSMLESMAMGAFPIQTETACCDEWFADGEGGFSIPHDNAEVIASKLRAALRDDALVDRAAAINWETVRTRLDNRDLQQKEVAFYNQIFNETTPS